MNRRPLVDEKCFELATHFLSTRGHGVTFPPSDEDEVWDLAGQFQKVAEDFVTKELPEANGANLE